MRLNNSKSDIDKKRRMLTKAVWATPIVTAVSLPAHAQTSSDLICSTPVMISFSDSGFIGFTLDGDTCTVITSPITTFISFDTTGDPDIVLLNIASSFTTIVGQPLSINIPEIINIRVRASGGSPEVLREWSGDIVFLYDGINLNVNGTLSPV